MFNSTLKNDALAIHQKAADRYDASYKDMMSANSKLYESRTNAIQLTKVVEEFINSIANTPKEFDKKMGLVREEIQHFKETEEYAKEALNNEIHSGVNIMAAMAAGNAFASMAPTVAMQIATTFGKASTGTAIKALSGAAAQKAALAWLGGGALSAGGAGIAGGQALLALAGPIGWSITAASAGVSLISMTKKNKKISNEAIENAKQIMVAKEKLDEITKRIEDLYKKTDMLHNRLREQLEQVYDLKGRDYATLDKSKQTMLGATVNNTLSLVSLINVVIE